MLLVRNVRYGENDLIIGTYVDLHDPLRTDESFENQIQHRRHKGISPLLQLNTKIISQFRLEPMHLVYEGVFKRVLEAWKSVETTLDCCK